MSSIEPSQIILQFVKWRTITKVFWRPTIVLRDALALVELGNIILGYGQNHEGVEQQKQVLA